ncbi:MAG: hypothetical protein ASARMPREDX12_001951 [Alectoria sarmentosa]|nr:MAG: hypothetical protein ASARMPRED_008724 [Alectoria sarmentosa]CAD6585263.1 MAG: hypothetical protein ASARMPREDX12_001951 [Alectoria sarmentosa]
MPLDFSHKNSSAIGTGPVPTINASLLGNSIDQHFKTITKVYPEVKVSGKSTYMNILKAMIKMSYSEGAHAYAGETFSFHDYTDVKIRIRRTSASFQYRYAIWGLFKVAQYLTENNLFACTIMDLYWSGGGTPVLVGVIEIFPHPMPGIAGSEEIQNLMGTGRRAETPCSSLNLANSSSFDSNEIDLAAPTNAGKLLVFLELQGTKLSVPEVFMTIFVALVHIASFETAHPVHDFEVQDLITKTELVYEHYGAPRESPPFFIYQEAARALGYIPKYMFAQHRFEAVTFVLEVDGTPVGTGFLRRSSSNSPMASQKV